MPSGARIWARPSLSTQAAAAERIVAAGVENHEVELGAGASICRSTRLLSSIWKSISASCRIGADRHEVVGAAHLQAVTGVVEQADIGARRWLPNSARRIAARLFEVELGAVAHQCEAERTQRGRHQSRIVRRVGEPRHVRIGRVADDQRHALVGERGRAERQAGHCDEEGPTPGSHDVERSPPHDCAPPRTRAPRYTPADRFQLHVDGRGCEFRADSSAVAHLRAAYNYTSNAIAARGPAMSDETQNVTMLKDAYARWADSKGASSDHWMSICAEKMKFGSLLQGQGAAYLTAYQSRDELGQYFDGLKNDWDMIEYVSEHFVAQGDRVVMLGRCSWRFKRTGKVVSTPKANSWRFADGKAVEFYEFYDTAQLRDAVS